MSVNVGILGFAHGHVGGYGPQWAAHPELGVTVTAGWDHNADRAKANAGNFPSMKLYDTVEELLASDIQAVVISSETSLHCELTEKAAAAGKDIICYKPMALTLAEADRMVAAVEKNNVRFTMGYQMRVDPQNQKIKQLIEDKEIGDTYYYRRRHGLTVHISEGFENVWHNDPKLNRDIFADDSSHPIDMLNWIFGVPESVSAEMSSMCKDGKIPNDTSVAVFKYPNGMVAEISCVMACSATEITTEVYGSRGAIAQNFGDNPSCRLPHGENGLKYFIEGNAGWTESGIPSPAGHFERIKAQYVPFAEFLNGKRGPVCSVYEGRDSLRMVLSCYLSAREGRRVKLDDPRIYEI